MLRNRRPCAPCRNRSSAAKRTGRGRSPACAGAGSAEVGGAARRGEEIATVLGVHVSTVRNWRGYFAHGGVTGLRRRQRPGQQAKIGPHAGAIAAAMLNEDTRHDGGWTLGRLCAEISRRGGPAISPRWLAHQLRQRGLPSVARATLSKGARTQRRSRRAVNGWPI